MRKIKFRINGENHFNLMMNILREVDPSINISENLEWKIFINYGYVDNTNSFNTGHNHYAYEKSDYTEVDMITLFTNSLDYKEEEEEVCEAKEDVEDLPIYSDVMLDVETLGTEPGSVIVSIGAVAFNMKDGLTGPSFYEVINLKESLDFGFNINGNTLKWWIGVDPKLLSKMIIVESGKCGISSVMNKFKNWIEKNTNQSEVNVWGNSNRFDIGLIAPYFKVCNMELPWIHFNERDVRTLVAFNPKIKSDVVTKAKDRGTELHSPVNDCNVQIEYCYKIFKSLGKGSARKKVYIASPYSKGDKMYNVNRQLQVADILINIGYTPYAPLIAHFQHQRHSRPYEDWMMLDLEWIDACDCVLRLDGESPGADREVKHAEAQGKPVFKNIHNLCEFYEDLESL